MLNVISTCRDILCVDINVDKRCVDHSTSFLIVSVLKLTVRDMQIIIYLYVQHGVCMCVTDVYFAYSNVEVQMSSISMLGLHNLSHSQT